MLVSKFILDVAKPFKFYILGTTLISFFFAFSSSFSPYLTKLLIDTLALNKGEEGVASVKYIVIIYIVFHFLTALGWRMYEWINLNYEPNFKNYISYKMIDYIGDHSYNFFQNTFAGSIAHRVGDAAKYIPHLIHIIINVLTTNFLSLIIAIYALYSIHHWFAFAIILWVCIFLSISLSATKTFSSLSKSSSEASSKIMGSIVDFLGNISSVRLFANKYFELQKLEEVQGEYLIAVTRKRKFAMKFYLVQGITITIYQAICLLMLVYLHSHAKVTPGDFAMLLGINSSIADRLWHTSEELKNFSENLGSVNQAMKILEAPHEIQDAPGAKDIKLHEGQIEYKNICFHYKNASPLFTNLSVTIPAGQKVGLVGYSGSGKTTFVNLLLRLFDVNMGEILIDSQNIQDITQESLRKNIALIPQEASLFHRSLMDNIKYGKTGASETAIIAAAKKAAAHDFISNIPEGYEALVGERGIKLSGGQRQRIAIARAILKDAPILILDEATSHLDSITEQEIQASIWQLMQGKTALVIAHRLSTLLEMDRILVFDHGRIVQDGSHQKLLKEEGLYKILWQSQIGGFLPDKPELK